MAYFAIRDDRLNRHLSSIKILSRREVSITNSDGFVLFRRVGDDVEFVSNGVLSNCQMERMPDRSYMFTADVAQLNDNAHSYTLQDLCYSLRRIYRFHEPERHFRQSYIHLDAHDHATMVKGSVYWARTAFGIFLNGLQDPAYTSFLQHVSQVAPDLLLQPPDYRFAWKCLRDFIESEYVAAAQLFDAVQDITEGLNAAGIDNLHFSDLGLCEEHGEEWDLLDWQQTQFRGFMHAIGYEQGRCQLIHELNERIEANADTEEAFMEVFEGTSWPRLPTDS